MRTRRPSRGSRTALFLVIATLIVGACASIGPPPSGGTSTGEPNAAPSPTVAVTSPTTSPAARPTEKPSPEVDVVEAFRAKVDGIRTFDARIAGTVSIGTTTLPVIGTFQTNGADSHQLLTITAAGKPQTTETITVGGTSYARRGEVWFAEPTGAAGRTNDFGAELERTIAGLTDLGAEPKDGVALHRLAPPPGTTIAMSSFGTPSPGASGGAMTVEFYATDDGTPAIITLDATWTQRVGKADQPASMHLDLDLDQDSNAVTIAEPSPIWVTGTSKRLTYTISYPSEWDVELTRKTGTPDYYFGLDGQGFAVTRTKKCACTLNAMTTELIRYQRQHIKGFKVARNTTTRVAGLRARVFESRGSYPGGRSWDLTYVVVRSKFVYVFDYSSDGPLTAADRATANQLVASIAFRGH